MERGLLLYIAVKRLAMLDTDILTVPALFLFILIVRLGLSNTQNLILYEKEIY